MKIFRHFRDCQAGASAVEFAIIGLVMITVSVGIIEIGRGLYLRNSIAHAADFAGRQVLMNPKGSDQELADIVRQAFSGKSPELLVIGTGTEVVGGVDFRTISIEYPLNLLIPTLLPETITLQLARRVPLL